MFRYLTNKHCYCHSPTPPNSIQVRVTRLLVRDPTSQPTRQTFIPLPGHPGNPPKKYTRFLVCNPPNPPTTHQTNSVLLLFKSAVSRELELNTDKSYKIEFGQIKFQTQIFLTNIFFDPHFFYPNYFFAPNKY